MIQRRVAIIAFVSMMSIASDRVCAFEFTSTRSQSMGGSASLRSATAWDYLWVTGLSVDRNAIALAFDAARRYDLKELDTKGVAFAFGKGRVSVAVGAVQLGRSSYYAERLARVNFAYRARAFGVGVAASAKGHDFGGEYSALHSQSIGVGLSWRGKRVSLAVGADDINQPRPWARAQGETIKWRMSFDLEGARGVTLAGHATISDLHRPVFGVGQSVAVTRAFRARWGVSIHPMVYTAGVEIGARSFAFHYGAWYHGALGWSQSVGASYRFSTGN